MSTYENTVAMAVGRLTWVLENKTVGANDKELALKVTVVELKELREQMLGAKKLLADLSRTVA